MGDRIGLFGGSFDPVHKGHLAVARVAMDQLGLSRLVWVPAGFPWQKGGAVASAEHRLAMLRYALAGEPDWEIDERELRAPGPSYTVDTLAAWRLEYPAARLWFILGWDAWQRLPTWKDTDRLLALATFAVVNRGGYCLASKGPVPTQLSMEPSAVASSHIRKWVQEGAWGAIESCVPRDVFHYMRQERLYEAQIVG